MWIFVKKIWHTDWLYTGIKKETKMNKPISKSNFQKQVMESQVLSLVQFKKQWNGLSQIIEPVYNELAKSYDGMVNFYTVDVEKEKGLEAEFGVMEIPTILFFKSGKIVDHVIGLTPKNIIISKIEEAMAGDANN